MLELLIGVAIVMGYLLAASVLAVTILLVSRSDWARAFTDNEFIDRDAFRDQHKATRERMK